MVTIIKTATVILMSVQLLSSCNNIESSRATGIKVNAFKDSLLEKQIDSSDFYISLPSNYSIRSSDGIDFSVYYFAPTDTKTKAEFSGGLYFGNFPGEFDKDNDSCKETIIKSKILSSIADWTVYSCNNGYTIQTIIDSEGGEDWNQKIHAFGNATSERMMHELLDIYSTLKRKKK